MGPITSSITGNEKLTKDQIIKELIELLNQNQQKSAANNVLEMTAYTLIAISPPYFPN